MYFQRKIGFFSNGKKINLRIIRNPCGCYPYQCGCCITIAFLFINESGRKSKLYI